MSAFTEILINLNLSNFLKINLFLLTSKKITVLTLKNLIYLYKSCNDLLNKNLFKSGR